MSKDFAIKIINSMVDENGHCGERGLSQKQFDIIFDAMDLTAKDEHADAGYWEGDYATINFWSIDWTGNVGPYKVTINEHRHFNKGCNVVSIDLRPEGEYEAEVEFERRMRELRDFSGSEWVAQPKKRLDMSLTLVNAYEYEGAAYSYYGSHMHYIYTLRDEQGNCIVWKTQNSLEWYDEDADEWVDAELGSVIDMRATVKEHSEYRGTKQTIINRPKINAIR